eukprot:TRINITY_DN18212_c0_g3_i1.p1 TRINITY_DN18212_c0_g3~~TRINITY_DN18212_c0_g3_i1.p1  ORF type:complete len:104 (+),score=7.74 TRINITY_DN18212_c0_g3_i1:122-433(+)
MLERKPNQRFGNKIKLSFITAFALHQDKPMSKATPVGGSGQAASQRGTCHALWKNREGWLYEVSNSKQMAHNISKERKSTINCELSEDLRAPSRLCDMTIQKQ